jgi:tetratricopeptide (TPR) repeat protein
MGQIRKDFFISYTGSDRPWAEWIAWQLEIVSGYSVIIQAWDFVAGCNFVLEIDNAAKQADHTIAVLSNKYLEALFTKPEWSAAFVQDPTGEKRLLIPVRIEDVKPDGLLASVVYVDLVGLSASLAKEHLLKEIRKVFDVNSWRPASEPRFPDSIQNESRLPGTLPAVRNLPRRNPNFTGRVHILDDLRKSLTKVHSTALTQQALYGLGGIGKSQLALEYAYQYCASYDLIWWLHAESPATLIADYIALAEELNLPESKESEQEKTIKSVRKWLDQHPGWLLIFDNAKDAKSILQYYAESHGGHVLITSRNQNWGAFGESLPVNVWQRSESINFLQRRTLQTDPATAADLADALGNLPLALEQAASFIGERKKSYAEYLELFKSRRKDLWDREQPPPGYPDTVVTTWSLAFDEIQQTRFAKELLFLCSIVASDDIPKSLLEKALSHYDETEHVIDVDCFDFDDAIAALRAYSLITPDLDKLSIHRLVQTVVKDRMNPVELSCSQHAMLRALSEQFPEKAYRNPFCWSECARLLSHAQFVLDYTSHDHDLYGQALLRLLNNIGEYHAGRGIFAEAEPLFRRSLEIREKQLGLEHLDVAESLNNLAVLLDSKGKYAEAEPLYRRSIEIREKQSGPEHLDVAYSLNNLAVLLMAIGKYAEAEPLYRRSLEIREKQLGPEHTDVADSLIGRAALLMAIGKYAEAEPLYRRSLEIREKQLGLDHPDVAHGLSNLAVLLVSKGNSTEAEPLYRRSLDIVEKQLGPDHPDVANSLNNLAVLLRSKGKYTEAEPLSRRSLEIREKQLGPDHPDVANSLNNLGVLLESKGKYAEAEPLFRRSLEIREKQLGLDHPDVANSLNNLAGLLMAIGKYAEAEPLFRRSLDIVEKQLGTEHPDVAICLKNLASLLEARKKYPEVKIYYRKALAVYEKIYGKNHIDTIAIRKKCGFQQKKRR